MKFKAKLVRGEVYAMLTRVYEAGKEYEIDAETKKYLEENAYDIVSVEGQVEPEKRCKFVFVPVEEAPIPTAQVVERVKKPQ